MRCVGAGAERRGGVLCVAPAYVVIPQAKTKPKKIRTVFLPKPTEGCQMGIAWEVIRALPVNGITPNWAPAAP